MEQTKPEYHVVSLSGGKDSTAMLLMMLERGMFLRCSLHLKIDELHGTLKSLLQL